MEIFVTFSTFHKENGKLISHLKLVLCPLALRLTEPTTYDNSSTRCPVTSLYPKIPDNLLPGL